MDTRKLRAAAARYRRLANAINDTAVVAQFEAYARELEERAEEGDRETTAVRGRPGRD
jgi:hypothetical protein